MSLVDTVEGVLKQKDFVRIIEPHLNRNVRKLMEKYSDLVSPYPSHVNIRNLEQAMKGTGDSMVVNYDTLPVTIASLFSDNVILDNVYFLISKKNESLYSVEALDEFLQDAVSGLDMNFNHSGVTDLGMDAGRIIKLGSAYMDEKIGNITLSLQRGFEPENGDKEPDLNSHESFRMPTYKRVNVVAFPNAQRAKYSLQVKELPKVTHNYEKTIYVNDRIYLGRKKPAPAYS